MSGKTKEEWKTYKNVFDEYTLRNLFKLHSQDHYDELQSPIAIGKEANVFTASHKEGHRVIIKIYRLENCDFNKMFQYLRTDPRFEDLKNQRRKIIFSWTKREYRNLMKAREVIRVPTPLAFRDNILILELIGEPAPKLKDVVPKDTQATCDKIIEMMRKLWHQGLVHGDLSEFNILNDNDEPIFIDFSQSTTTEDHIANELLERDCKNIARFFRKYDVEISPEEIKQRVLS